MARAQVCSTPVLTAMTLSPVPARTGALRSTWVPSPNWPRPFQPQHAAVLSVPTTPQLNAPPDLTALKSSPPATATGAGWAAFPPSPSWPERLNPQQYASWVVVTPQLCPPPALTTVKCKPPETRTGNVRSVCEPSPTSPSRFQPQQ